jgi:hypothetical protein
MANKLWLLLHLASTLELGMAQQQEINELTFAMKLILKGHSPGKSF